MILVVAIVLWLLAVLEVWACCVVAARADEQMDEIFRKEHHVHRLLP